MVILPMIIFFKLIKNEKYLLLLNTQKVFKIIFKYFKMKVFVNTFINTQKYLKKYLNTKVFKYCPSLNAI